MLQEHSLEAAGAICPGRFRYIYIISQDDTFIHVFLRLELRLAPRS